MTFDPDSYWKANGPYLAGPDGISPEHQLVQVLLTDVLKDLGPIKDVLDVGCGRGRVAALLKDVLPKAKYAGVDIGAAQVEATQGVRPDGVVTESRIQDFEPDRQWDLVLASEVLMHIAPKDIQAVCDKLRRLARKWVVTVDWTAPMDGEIAPWNWLFDYPALFRQTPVREDKVGQQTVFLFRGDG